MPSELELKQAVEKAIRECAEVCEKRERLDSALGTPQRTDEWDKGFDRALYLTKRDILSKLSSPSEAPASPTKEESELPYTENERIAAVKEIVEQWPAHSSSYLFDAEGDSLGNIAVYLQMKLNRASIKPKAVCVDCRDYEANIRGWIEQLGGNKDDKYISLELERLIGALKPKAEEGWVSVEERMPEFGKPILYVVSGDHANPYVVKGKRQWDGRDARWGDGDGEFSDVGNDSPHSTVKHWRPLPSPPSSVLEETKEEIRGHPMTLLSAESVGPILHAARISKGISQRALAKMCNLSFGYIRGFENGRINPTLKQLETICMALGVITKEAL